MNFLSQHIAETEEELEKEFADMLNLVETQTGETERGHLKLFVSSREKLLVEKIIERITRMRVGITEIAEMNSKEYGDGWNYAISELLKSLQL